MQRCPRDDEAKISLTVSEMDATGLPSCLEWIPLDAGRENRVRASRPWLVALSTLPLPRPRSVASDWDWSDVQWRVEKRAFVLHRGLDLRDRAHRHWMHLPKVGAGTPAIRCEILFLSPLRDEAAATSENGRFNSSLNPYVIVQDMS